MKALSLATSLVCAGFVLGCGGSAKPPLKVSPGTSEPKTSIGESKATELFDSKSTEKSDKTPARKSRSFTFHYRFKVKDLKPAEDAANSVVRVWLPSASASDEQEVKRLDATAPTELSENADEQFGNRILFFETKIPESGEFSVDVPYAITRREVLHGLSQSTDRAAEKLDETRRKFFLRADTMVPTTGKPLKLLDMIELMQDKFACARQIYDIVDNHVAYKKEGTGWGRGDTNWVCDSRYGNCTDFHSLFISLARSQGLPARFEIGFSIPTDKPEGSIAGYHCWARTRLDSGRYLRSGQEPDDERLLLRRPDRRPRDVFRRP
ncbi:MAG: transglutaminase-like [Planctomycetota bacterium]|nr:MAG: transglutaminase-like [Planctomycetota bacterium]